MKSEKVKQYLSWAGTQEGTNGDKILSCTSLDVETLCPRVYASNNGTYALYEVAPNLIFSIARRCTSVNWRIPPDFDSLLQVYVGYEKSTYTETRDYFYWKGCEFTGRKSKRKELIKTTYELKLTKFKVYDVLDYFESTNLDSVFILF